MRLSYTLVSSLLFASKVLASPSRYYERLAEGTHRPYEAGVALSKGYGTFQTVAASITIPVLSRELGSVATAWVGIDGVTCNALRVGVRMILSEDNSSIYEAWSQMYPEKIRWYKDMEISPRDTIHLRVDEYPELGMGIVTLRNHKSGQVKVDVLPVDSSKVCGKDAQWIVARWKISVDDPEFHPLANFGGVTFWDILANGTDGYYNPTDKPHAVFDIEEPEGRHVTSTSFTESFITVEHV